MFKKLILIVSIILISGASTAEEAKVSTYVNYLLKTTLAILQDSNKSVSEKVKESEVLIGSNMDLEWMSKFVLGKHRRTISPEDLKKFTHLYSNYLVKTYSNAVKFYKPNQSIKVKSESPLNTNEYIVKTSVITPGADPINIDYIIRDMDQGSTFKVFDVVTEGISLINSHQAEFANIISNSDFQNLLAELKEKIKSLDSANYGSKE